MNKVTQKICKLQPSVLGEHCNVQLSVPAEHCQLKELAPELM